MGLSSVEAKEGLMLEQFFDHNVIANLLSIFSTILRDSLSSYDYLPNLSSQLFDGKVSHIVAAAIETKGLIDQGKILKNLGTLNELAGLFYLFAFALAVGAVAVFGNYRQGVYFLLGPVFYTFMVTQTVETNGVRAVVGNYEIPNSRGRQSKFLKAAKTISPEEGTTARISLFFAAFDGIVSEVIQQVNSMLLDTNNREHLKIEGRERVLAYVLMTTPTSSVIPKMIVRHQSECTHVMNEFFSAGKDKKKNVFKRERSQADVEKEKALAEESWGEAKISLGSADTEMKAFMIGMAKTPGFPQSIGITDENQEVILTCKQMWGIIAATLLQVADKALDPDYYRGSKESDDFQPKKQEYADVKESIEAPYKGISADKLLAAQIYKNVLTQTTHSALNSQLFSNSPFNGKEFHTAYSKIPGAEARGAYFGLRYFATSVPYIQGLLLYLLSIAFPFFAVLLVMPGKAQSFFMWCSLWVWVKSWDVGFALVLVIRDLLWHMLKYRQNTFDNTLDLNDPFSVYGVILNNDPLATTNTYWEIAFALTAMVPLLTAHFCLGATNVFEMFRSGIDQTVGRFRQFETLSGKRSIANALETSRDDEKFRFQQMMMLEQLNSAPANTQANGSGGLINPFGAQTMYGEPIARDRPGYQFDKVNVANRLANVSGAQAMVAFEMAGAFSQFGTKDYLDQIQREVGTIFDIEARIANSLKGKNVTESFNPPREFKGVADLSSPVPKEVMERSIKEYNEKIEGTPVMGGKQDEARKLQFDQNKSYNWGEYLETKALQEQKELRIPHVMRGIPNLNGEVSKEKLEYMFQDASHPLRQRAAQIEAGTAPSEVKAVTWADAIQGIHESQRSHYSELAATVGRRFMPNAQLATDGFSDAIVHAESISMLGRTAISGVGGKGPSSLYTLPGVDTIIGRAAEFAAGKEVTIDSINQNRPGISSDQAVQGNAAKGSTVGQTSK